MDEDKTKGVDEKQPAEGESERKERVTMSQGQWLAHIQKIIPRICENIQKAAAEGRILNIDQRRSRRVEKIQPGNFDKNSPKKHSLEVNPVIEVTVVYKQGEAVVVESDGVDDLNETLRKTLG
jgi:hypothetical protein